MKTFLRRLLMSSLLAMLSTSLAAADTAPARKGLTAFTSDAELAAFLTKHPTRRPPAELGGGLDEIAVTGTRVSESITNTQTDGVDEGAIVKVHGDQLVVLRRGRLFTIDVTADSLRPVQWIDANGPGMDPGNTWYDEMLIHKDRIIVIGYSYDYRGTEIVLFDIDAKGRMRYDSTYHLRSGDYYSSRNYASRLKDGKLIFYSPIALNDLDSLPALRRWPTFMPPDQDKQDDGFARIAAPSRIYRPAGKPSFDYPLLHTITSCDLDAAELSCEATGFVGGDAQNFYVSRDAVYVWVGPSWLVREKKEVSTLYRLPLDGSLPSALQTFGNPIDQFSFLDHDGYLNVLVAAESRGAWMWRAEENPGALALLRVPLSKFGTGTSRPVTSDYLPLPATGDGSIQNRFVGEWLLYGSGDGWYDNDVRSTTLHVVNPRARRVTDIALPHGSERIEALGSNAVVIGSDKVGTLHFTGVDLINQPRLHRHFELANAAQAELRSHGFFYSPNTLGGALGLPIRGEGGPNAWRHLRENAAAVLFLRVQSDAFSESGMLSGESESTDDHDDGCHASCVDWYGNARPIFLRGRVFALLGYELVEGRAVGDRLEELRRVSFAPLVDR